MGIGIVTEGESLTDSDWEYRRGGALIIFIDLEEGGALWSDGVFKPITEIEIHTQEEE